MSHPNKNSTNAAKRHGSRPRLLYVVTASRTAILLRGQLSHFKRKGYEVGLLSSPGSQLTQVAQEEGVQAFEVPMEREINPIADLVSLFRLARFLAHWRPDVIHFATPKAGLIAGLASFWTRVPKRIYGLWGLPLESRSGWKRSLLWVSEKIASACAHQVWAVSHSLRESYISKKLVAPKKIRVLGEGSSNGIDKNRFIARESEVSRLRESLGIGHGDPVIGFVGRLTPDKGVAELWEVFQELKKTRSSLKLLVIGDIDVQTVGLLKTIGQMKNNPDVVLTGLVDDASTYYHLMDVFVFPSHREGFPNVILEAGLCRVPCVGFSVTGVKDAIRDGVTGYLAKKGDLQGMAAYVETYLSDPRIAEQHAEAAAQRINESFTREAIWSEIEKAIV